VASQEIRDRRRVMRYRDFLVRQSVQMKNRVGRKLMETGISYNKQKLHQRRYFNQLLKDRANELPSSMPELLRLSRSTIDGLGQSYPMESRTSPYLRTGKAERTSKPRHLGSCEEIVAYLLAVDRSGNNFQPQPPSTRVTTA
jgi:hypothetical protein